MNALIKGMAAGAVGVTALNLAGYIDMLVRGRPASRVPSELAAAIAEKTGIQDLAPNTIESGAPMPYEGNQAAEARREALGSMFGIIAGLKVGAFYALTRPMMGPIPLLARSLVVGGTAMAASDVTASLLGVTDPRRWSAMDWLSDVVPHVAYGVATVATYEYLISKDNTRDEVFKALDQVLQKAHLR